MLNWCFKPHVAGLSTQLQALQNSLTLEKLKKESSERCLAHLYTGARRIFSRNDLTEIANLHINCVILVRVSK